MKNLILILVIAIGIYSCNTTNKTTSSSAEISSVDQETVRIANEESNYEIIIIEPGFNSWLKGRAKPEGYYSQQF